jgi:hypothetical protein
VVAANLLLLGAGTFNLDRPGNNVATLAANLAGAVTYRDADLLTVGSVGAVNGLNTGGNNLTLNTGGALTLGDGSATPQNITAAGANVTLNPTAGGVTENANSTISAAGLLLLGAGTFNLNQPGNDVATLAANLSGPLLYQDGNALVIGSVGATRGVNGSANNITLTTGGQLTVGTGTAGEDITASGAALALTSGSGVAENVNSKVVAKTLTVTAAGSVLLGNNSPTPASPQPQNQIAELGQSSAGGEFYLYNAAVTPRPALPVIPGAVWIDPNDSVQKAVVGLQVVGDVRNTSSADTILRTVGDLDIAASGSVAGNGGRIILSAENGIVGGSGVNNSSFHNFTTGNTPAVRSQASSTQMGLVYVFSQDGALNTPPDPASGHTPDEEVSQGHFYFGSTVPTDNLLFSDAAFSVPNFDSFLSVITARPGAAAVFRNPQPALWSEYANIFVEPVKLPTLSTLEFEVQAAYETNRAKMKAIWTSSYDLYKKKAPETQATKTRQVSANTWDTPLVADIKLALKPELDPIRNED